MATDVKCMDVRRKEEGELKEYPFFEQTSLLPLSFSFRRDRPRKTKNVVKCRN